MLKVLIGIKRNFTTKRIKPFEGPHVYYNNNSFSLDLS